jgi:hypothetical protein
MVEGFGDADFMVDPLQGVPEGRSSKYGSFFMQGIHNFQGSPMVRFFCPDAFLLEFLNEGGIFDH